MGPGYLVVALLIIGALVGLVVISMRVAALARRHSRWSLTVHYAEPPTIDTETVNRALTTAFPGTTFASTLKQPNQWVATVSDGEYIVKRHDGPTEGLAAKATHHLTLSLLAAQPPTEAQHEATLENLCRLAAAFARKGAAFVSCGRSFPSQADKPVVLKSDQRLLEQLAAGRAEVFKPGV